MRRNKKQRNKKLDLPDKIFIAIDQSDSNDLDCIGIMAARTAEEHADDGNTEVGEYELVRRLSVQRMGVVVKNLPVKKPRRKR